MTYKRSKAMLILFLVALLLFFTSDFQLIDIEKTAIIVALAVDKQQDEFEVTAQVAIPQATNEESTNSDALLSGKGKSMYEAIEDIALKTGWYPKLTFCNLIIFGNEVVNGNFFPIVDYILTSDRFQTSAVLCTTDKQAKDILKCTTPLDFISSFALQKILLRNVERANTVLAPDVREFCVNNRSYSQFCYLPIVKFIEEENAKNKGGQSQTSELLTDNTQTVVPVSNQGGEGKSGSGKQDGQQKKGVFDAGETLFFTNGKKAFTATTKQTLCFNLLVKKVGECFLDVDFIKNGKQTNALISIIQNRGKIKLEIKNGIPKLFIKLDLVCEKEETFLTENSHELQNSKVVSPEGLLAVENAVYEYIEQLIQLSKSNECDIFKLKNQLYQKHNSYFLNFKNNLLNLLQYQIEINCKSLTKA